MNIILFRDALSEILLVIGNYLVYLMDSFTSSSTYYYYFTTTTTTTTKTQDRTTATTATSNNIIHLFVVLFLLCIAINILNVDRDRERASERKREKI